MEILLTNDDSHDSPLFHFLIDRLQVIGRVTITVPNEEQSWTGKSMTRFRKLRHRQVQIHGHAAHTLDGTPADCANFGIYHLYESKPDLVVSGINIGINTGVAYAMSSGTIGACLEANIAGIPAVALSQELSMEVYWEFTRNRRMSDEVTGRLDAQTAEVLGRLFGDLRGKQDLLTRPVTWSANIPYRTRDSWEIVPAALGHSFYGSCFEAADGGYQHNVAGTAPDRREHADWTVLKRGDVTLTCLDIRAFGQLEP